MKRYVIIGGSIAGINCVEGIRSIDSEGEITLVSSEPVSNYARPLISYYLEGKTTLPLMSYRGADFYEKNGVCAFHNVTAQRIDPSAHKVLLSDGKELSYDALCVAAGSHPFVPKFEGLENVRARFSFTTLSDALEIERIVSPGSRVLIIGAGFIGLKCAEALAGKVREVTVCDLAEHAMSSILDAESAPILERHLEHSGIQLMLGNTVARFEENKALMRDGNEVAFDILVTAIGVRSNAELISEAGGGANKGILVSERMETSLPDIWAAGDCTESLDITTAKPDVLAILPNAAMQGRCAGVNMAGGSAVFDKGIKMNSIGFFGLHIMTAGTYTVPVYSNIDTFSCKKLFARDNVLTGFILIGDVARAGIYTSLIRERTPLSEIDFEAVMKEPSLLPFGREYRVKKLGGVVI